MNDEEKEQYARRLARRAERAVGAIKILFFTMCAVAAATVIYSVIIAATGFIKSDVEGALTGLAVFVCCMAAQAAAVAACAIVARLSLNKLKNLN